MIQFPQDFKEFLHLLNSEKIEYLVIGGYAVGFYGYPRATGDMDIWIAVNQDTAMRMVVALRKFGFNLPELREELFLGEVKVLRMGVPPMRLEIFTEISGVSFKECYEKRKVDTFGDLEVNFIAFEDLVKNKREAGSPKDLSDLDALVKIHNKGRTNQGR